MDTRRLSPPTPLDIIPADEVAAVISTLDREFVELEQRAHELRTEAEEASRRAQDAGIDPDTSSWAMVRLQRFLDGLREEARREAAATVEVARHRARHRVDEARMEAAHRGRDLPHASAPDFVHMPQPVTPAPSPPMAVPAMIDLSVVDEPSGNGGSGGVGPAPMGTVATAVPTQVPQAPAVARPLAAPHSVAVPEPQSQAPTVVVAAAAPSADAPVLRVAPVAPVPTAPDPAAPAPDAAQPAPETVFWAADPVVLGPSGDATRAMPAAPVAGTDSGKKSKRGSKSAKPAQSSKAKSSALRRIPVSAVIEVIAVVMILVFILWRLS